MLKSSSHHSRLNPIFGASLLALMGVSNSSFGAEATVAFTPLITYPVGKSPTSLVVGDISRDKNADIVMGNADGSLAVMLGKGDGEFGSAAEYAVGSGSVSVAVADFNKDGRQDIAAVSTGAMSVFLGKGKGGFKLLQQYPITEGLDSLKVADLNRDRNLDVVMGITLNKVEVFRGKGDGKFKPLAEYSIKENAQESADVGQPVALADMNGDKRIDILTATYTYPSPTNYRLFLANKQNAYAYFKDYAWIPDAIPSSTVVADVNRDGRLDLLATTQNYARPVGLLGGGVGILSGIKGDFFGNSRAYSPPNGGAPNALAVGDINRDGKLDVVTANRTYHHSVSNSWIYQSIGLYLGNESGGLDSLPNLPMDYQAPYTYSSPWIALADLNRDGKQDIVITDDVTQSVSVFINTSR